MSGGAHGLQPSGHEHVHCEWCGANGVHVVTDVSGLVVYGPHAIKGGEVQCRKSRSKVVPVEHRHQGDPR